MINKKCRDYALANGHLNFKTIDTFDSLTKKPIKKEIIDVLNPYTPNNPEEYKIVILDNASNLTQENGLDKRGTIEKLSKYAITLRDQLNFTFILIQHQAQDKEGNESVKLDRIKPSSDGLADCKTTTRDANMVIGIYSPYKYGKTTYEGYDITKFKNRIRFMEILEDRDYGANGNICPLYFDGNSAVLSELPLSNDIKAMAGVYKFLDQPKTKEKKSILMTLINKIKR